VGGPGPTPKGASGLVPEDFAQSARQSETSFTYEAFGVFGALFFRALGWKTPIFLWRAVPKTPNAS
jgi:hypothetical protein